MLTTMAPQHLYTDQRDYQPLVYIPSPYSLSAASCFPECVDPVSVGVKRKRDDFEDSCESDVDLCLSLLQTSLSKLQKVPITTSRGRRRSPSLHRSVLIINMLHTLQNGCTASPQNLQQLGKTLAVGDEDDDDDEDAVVHSSWNVEAEPQSDSNERDLWQDTLSGSEAYDNCSKDMVDDCETNDSSFEYTSCKIEQDALTETNSIPRFPHGNLWPKAAEIPSSLWPFPQHSVSSSQTFQPDQMFDLEESLIDFDALDSYLLAPADNECSKEAVPQSAQELDMYEQDIEYLLHVLVET